MINFNGSSFPKFVVVNKIRTPILPPISQNKTKISNRPGNLSFGNELDSRSITMEISIIADSLKDLDDKARLFAEYLYHNEPKKLIINKGSVYYMAQITDSTDFNEIQEVGQGTLRFICDDPFAYSINEKSVNINPIASYEPEMINNTGQLEVHPQMEFTFDRSLTSFDIVTGDKVMSFGNPNADQTPKNIDPIIFRDDMTSGAGWATANYVEDGVVSNNQFASNGWLVRPVDYGIGPRWHGPAGVKSLGTQLTDFRVSCDIGLNTKVGEMGRVQVYGLDINGNVIFFVSMRNASETQRPYAEVKIGHKLYLETYGDRPGAFHPFEDGRISIVRRGKSWAIYYAKIGKKGDEPHHTTLYREFNIDHGGYELNKLAQIQIHIGAWKDAETYPVPTVAHVSDLKVWDLSPTLGVTEKPVIFKAGDKLVVDSATDGIFLNGEPYLTSLDPSSQFPILNKGNNGIMVIPPHISSGTVKFRERFW